MIIFLPLCHIKFFPLSDGFVFGVPEYQIRDMKALCQFSSVFDGAVMFLIRLEAVTLIVQAERLVEQPVASLYIRFTGRIVRFITGAGQLFPIFQNRGKTKLTGFGGMDVEECDIVIQNM